MKDVFILLNNWSVHLDLWSNKSQMCVSCSNESFNITCIFVTVHSPSRKWSVCSQESSSDMSWMPSIYCSFILPHTTVSNSLVEGLFVVIYCYVSMLHFQRCWAVALFGGNSETGFDQNTTYSIFSISITLTDEGFQNFYEVKKTLNICYFLCISFKIKRKKTLGLGKLN